MKILPNSVSSIPFYLANVPKDSCVLLEPFYKLPLLGLAGAKCLEDSRNNIPHMQVLNPTNKAITLRATTTIADASVVDPASVFTLDHPKQHVTSKTNESHDPIQFDLEQSDLSSDQKKNVNSLSIPTSLCICVLEELGHANTQPRRIETGHAPPVRQRIYRQSPQTNAEMNRQLKEMLEADIIEESDTMWQSPFVMVKKKNMSEGKFLIK